MPFIFEDLDYGFKYLGYYLQPNFYRVSNWFWLIKKVEAKFGLWYHSWLSLASQHVLLQYILQRIPLYWISLEKVPKIILEKIRNINFHFLWYGTRDKEAIPLVKWTTLASPKKFDGWGFKNSFFFGKSLVMKNL